MNPFLRDEPPMLGASTAPGSSPRTNGQLDVKNSAAVGSPGGRSSSSNDLYAQSFGRTKPRPSGTEASKPEDGGAATNPPETQQPPETQVRKTALSTSPESSNSPGVILKPPVSLTTKTRSTAHPTDKPSDPAKPTEATPSMPPAAPAPTDSAAREPQPQPGHDESSVATAESIVAAAQGRLDTLTSYQVEINRQERVGDQLQAPEDVVLSIRRNPKAVRLEWRNGSHKGREVLFSQKETNGLMRINMADTPIPIPPFGLPPDSPLILRSSRHPITEAGFETIIANLKKTIEENKAGDHSHGKITYGGTEQPEQLDHPCQKIIRVTATGETWQVFLDPASSLPVMVEGKASDGALLERYLFRNVHPDPPELASADAFDPNRRWGEAKGLLSRLAEAAESQKTNPGATR
jgi:hypothetical protein